MTIQCSIERKLDEPESPVAQDSEIIYDVNIRSSKYLKISVIDTGMGISKEN